MARGPQVRSAPPPPPTARTKRSTRPPCPTTPRTTTHATHPIMPCPWAPSCAPQSFCAQHNISTLHARTRAALDHAVARARYARRHRLRWPIGRQPPPPHAAEVGRKRGLAKRHFVPRRKFARAPSFPHPSPFPTTADGYGRGAPVSLDDAHHALNWMPRGLTTERTLGYTNLTSNSLSISHPPARAANALTPSWAAQAPDARDGDETEAPPRPSPPRGPN